MALVKRCDGCGKTISAGLHRCWTCWNEGKSNQHKVYSCSCGMDISPEEFNKPCEHSTTQKLSIDSPKAEESPQRVSRKLRNQIELIGQDDNSMSDWRKWQRELDMVYLMVEIDGALEAGNKELFMELSTKLNKLREESLV